MGGGTTWNPGSWHGVVCTPGGEWWSTAGPRSAVTPGMYTIRVPGQLDGTWSNGLGGMRITVSGTGATR